MAKSSTKKRKVIVESTWHKTPQRGDGVYHRLERNHIIYLQSAF